MLYHSTITSSSLRLRESRLIANLLITDADQSTWDHQLYTQNVLQLTSPKTVTRISRLLRSRLETMTAPLWLMVRDGDRELATQSLLAAAIKHSRILGDFLDIAIRDQRALFAKTIDYGTWATYLEGCRARDPEMPEWSDGTIARLRSTVFTILAEAGYLKDTRTLALQNVYVADELVAYLQANNEHYVLRCLEVTG